MASNDGDEDVGNPTKKSTVTKKGTAKVVKKGAAKAREVNDDEDASVKEEEVEAAPLKAKSRAKATPKTNAAATVGKKPAISKSKSEVAAEQGRIALNGAHEAMGAETDGDGMDGMVPMKFEQEV